MATTKVRYNQIKTGLPAGGDLNYSDVSLLLNMEGNNGSTTFTDSSNSGKAVSAESNASINTAQFKFGSSSYDANNSDAELRVSNTVLPSGANDFTVECWIYLETIPSTGGGSDSDSYIFVNWGGSSNSLQFLVHREGGLRIIQKVSGSNVLIAEQGNTNGWSINTWYHVAATRSGDAWRVFRDGALLGSDSYSGSNYLASDDSWIGGKGNAGYVKGYLDNFRISSGIARYTSNFSVPTAAFPAFESKEGKELRVGANGTIELES